MSKWSDKWNRLPEETRLIGAMCSTEQRINQLEVEKARLKKRYLESVREINSHIKNLKHWLLVEDHR